ncbi:hypothetical protein [Natrinema sp. 1APR25-10V2]|uniref:hypothetical protein n=1 Tax=Natrinema sp. 1APR25-10V2 TaxID=2951081 RepID=UPI0028772289|nr:hypothetical protein [Natrinema sp. 1APR25-10V2]MDS0474342.1 hypothetical protein [Natrinema sp. 1APR25-10V2]
MYNEEWEPAMTADSMDERIEELAQLARTRAEKKEKPIDDVVHEMTHDAYLMKHTTGDVLSELDDLQALYPEEFYNGGDANNHIMSYLDEAEGYEFWADYIYLSLGAGLEWAILDRLDAN